ncbi:MAG: alpha-mannosidase [Haloarculaceae archaeon]
MLDNTLEKRAAETQARLDDLRVAERREITDLAALETREFLDPEEVRDRDREFEPCSVGFTWERGRETVPDDRRAADADVLTGEVSPELAVGRNVWFRLRFAIPESMAGYPVFLRFIARPRGGDEERDAPRVESLCFRDGVPWQAFDNRHESLRLTEEAEGGESFDLLVEAGTTTLWGNLDVEAFVLQAAEIYAERPRVADLHRHVSVCTDLAEQFDEDSPNRGRLLNALAEASHAFPFEAGTTDGEAETADREGETADRYREGAETALEPLRAVEEEITSDLTGHDVTAVGHAHIDLAWLWPWSETVRKCGRSFSNVLRLLDEYPEFTFTQSQPHLYEWVRNRYPEQFDAIRERVDEGRWHPEGALWVESDVNNVGSEALARQFLYGKRYFREEFDADPEVAFIPDVFGYSPGLPGVARAADCPYFLTQKMSWSEVNDFPHSTFRWEGIDGSELLAHFPPADTYNGEMTVDEVTESVYGDAQNDVADDRAYLVGIGDGGGGPTREMVERSRVLDDVEALPDIEWGSLAGLFDRLAGDWDEYPVWSGELYLEKHRATLTTQARTKRNNREGEHALAEAELWSSLALALADEPYPHDDLESAWKVLLFNQFHDVLPGSSVTDVYTDADRDYERVFDAAADAREAALDALVGLTDRSDRLCLTNPLSWSRRPTATVPAADVALGADDADAGADDALVAVPDGAATDGDADGSGDAAESGGPGDPPDPLPVQRTTAGPADDVPEGEDALVVDGPAVPALGATTAAVRAAEDPVDDPFEASTERLSNGLVTVTFEDDGTVSVYDEEAERAVLDEPGNRLVSYRDQPRAFDAWDVEEDVYAVGDQLPAPESTVVESGPVRATVRQRRRFGDSELVQDVSLSRGSKRVEFRTRVEWREDERFLKAHFPAAVHARSATYETHFGHHERPTHDNTDWDRARHEEACGAWVDVSEPGYGVAVLNDCKYGCHVDGTDVSLSLLRAPNYPDPGADRGTHEFTYALLPHTGGPAAVARAADELNAPTRALPAAEPTEIAPVDVDPGNVVVEAVKRAEDRPDGLVVRLYESAGRRADATVSFGFPVADAAETNLVEDRERDLDAENGTVELEFDPFEIRTIEIGL